MTMLEDAPVTTIPIIADDVACVTRARDLFANDPSRWTAGATARDKRGYICLLDKADSVCAMGALTLYGLPTESGRITGWGMNLVMQLGYFAHNDYGFDSIVGVNDRLGIRAVIAVFDVWLKWREENPDADMPSSAHSLHWTPFLGIPIA